VMLTEYHGRNIETARTADPSADSKRPRDGRLSTTAQRLSAAGEPRLRRCPVEGA
jgi:hypothetical protein